MSTIAARLFDGATSREHAVVLSLDAGGRLRVDGDGIARDESLRDLRITSRLARTPRTIVFPDGARALVDDAPALDAWFPTEDRLQRLVDRLEGHAYAVAVSLVICVVSLFAAFTWGVPWLADRITDQMPPTVEAALGNQVLDQLDRFFGFRPTQLEQARRDELSARFAKLAATMPGGQGYRLEFRHAEAIGANALAIPGGTVVVTDDLVNALQDDREFDAIMAHELGHQEHRHALRQALRSSFVAVAAGLFAGDVSSAGTIVVAVPTMLVQSHYSRGFEDEADRFAFERLAAAGESPAWFAEAMRRLIDEHDLDDGDVSWASTHPATTERIAAAVDAGAAFLEAHPERAKDSPGYDACAAEGICPEESLDEDDCDEDCQIEICTEYDGYDEDYTVEDCLAEM